MIKRAVLLAMTLAGVNLWSGVSQAATHYTSDRSLQPVIYTYRSLTAGTQYTIETKDGNGDPVMHILDSSGTQVAYNDDGGSGLNSKVVFTPSSSGGYRIFVRSYGSSSAGAVDLYVNNSKILTQAPFGTQVTYFNWSSGQKARVTPSNRDTGSRDPMLFLLSSSGQVAQMNDDSGPNLYPLVTTNSAGSSSSRAVWGLYPGRTNTTAHLTFDDPIPCVLGLCPTDPDKDGVSTSLENLVGTSASSADSDSDGVPDGLELHGNNGFSMSEGGNPKRRTIWVEVDRLSTVTAPYNNLVTDVSNIFSADGSTDINIILDQTNLTYRQMVDFSCPSNLSANCSTVASLKASNFSTSNPERQPYFHYAIWADQRVDTSVSPPAAGCSSGVATILGQDLVISLGCWSNTNAQHRGTFVHELGHNLNLTHNGNDSSDSAKRSTVHASVMNYRYQMAGIPGSNRHTYSTGSNGCASCQTSPKALCEAYRNLNILGVNGCQLFPNCDCDLNEWGTFKLDFNNGGSGSGVSAGQADELAGDQDAAFDALARNQEDVPRNGRADEALDKVEQRWQGPIPSVPPGLLRARVARQRAAMEAEGLQDEFRVSEDGTQLISNCIAE